MTETETVWLSVTPKAVAYEQKIPWDHLKLTRPTLLLKTLLLVPLVRRHSRDVPEREGAHYVLLRPHWKRGQFYAGHHVADVQFARRHWRWMIRIDLHRAHSESGSIGFLRFRNTL